MRLSTLLLSLALPVLIACGGSDPAPVDAPADAPSDAPADPPAPAPEATPDPAAEQTTAAHSVVLDGAASSIEWTSIKNGDAPVKGKFTKVSGGLALTAADLGATTGSLTIDLSGIDSALELRDMRIAETFFGAAPDAAKQATLTLAGLEAEAATLEPGGSTAATATFTLALESASVTLEQPVQVTRADANGWTVATTRPARLSIQDLGLSDRLAALIKLCAHQSVDDTVTVDASLTFKAPE